MTKARGKTTRSNQPEPLDGFFIEVGQPDIKIAAWCPDTHAQLPPEQVHLIFTIFPDDGDVPPLLLRFKSPDTLGFLIEELTRYRRHVWPDAEPLTLEEQDGTQ
jgi:hypothetical protein